MYLQISGIEAKFASLAIMEENRWEEIEEKVEKKKVTKLRKKVSMRLWEYMYIHVTTRVGCFSNTLIGVFCCKTVQYSNVVLTYRDVYHVVDLKLHQIS